MWRMGKGELLVPTIQLLFNDNGKRRARGLLHDACNFAMIARMPEFLATMTEPIILERLEDPLHIRRYFLKRVSAVYFSPGQRLLPTIFANLFVSSFHSLVI